MKRRIKLKRTYNKNINIKITKLNISIVLIILFTLFWILIINKEASPILFNYAKLETKKMATTIINNAVTESVEENLNIEDLVTTTLNDNKEIVGVDFNTVNVNKSLNTITNTIELNLRFLEEGRLDLLEEKTNEINRKNNNGIVYEIPFGVVFYTPLLADLGPKIPVKVKMAGSVATNVKTKITNYGINNAMLEVFIEVEVDEQIILPFISKTMTLKQEVPVAIKVIQGTVPEYYGGSMCDRSSLLSIPIEK